MGGPTPSTVRQYCFRCCEVLENAGYHWSKEAGDYLPPFPIIAANDLRFNYRPWSWFVCPRCEQRSACRDDHHNARPRCWRCETEEMWRLSEWIMYQTDGGRRETE